MAKVKNEASTKELLKNLCTIYVYELTNGVVATANDVERFPNELKMCDKLSVDMYLRILFDSFEISSDKSYIYGTTHGLLNGPQIEIHTFPSIIKLSKDGEECQAKYVDNIGIASYLNMV